MTDHAREHYLKVVAELAVTNAVAMDGEARWMLTTNMQVRAAIDQPTSRRKWLMVAAIALREAARLHKDGDRS